MQTAPKYSKIEIIFNDERDMAIHNDCGMFISGNKLVIVEDTNDSILNTQVTEGIIYDLDVVGKYKTYKL